MSILLPRQKGDGSARNTSNSASGLLSTLIPVFIVAAISVTIFLILRKKYAKVYQPRSQEGILYQDTRRTPHNNKGFFANLADVKGLPDYFVLEHNSLDGYLFLRFFKILIVISLVGICITWPILFPVNATGGGGQSQLDVLSFSNVVSNNRYYAHAICAWLFLGFITLLVTRERMYFIGLRQAYFLSTLRAKRLTSRTVLFMNIPKDQQTEQAMRTVFGSDVRNVWIATDCKKLEEIVKDRNKAALKLEAAEVKMSKQANKLRIDAEKKNPESQTERRDPNSWIENKKRPTHRLKPIIGKKVDTVNWARVEVPRMNKDIAREQASHQSKNATTVSAAFVEFTSQAAAQRAFQLAAKSIKQKKQFQPRYIDVNPDEVIWKNLGVSWASRKIKLIIATVLFSLIVIFWTPIIAFVGALTNIQNLTATVPFLSFINKIPSVILGVVTGLLPTIVLAVCIMLVPIICRQLAKLAGEPTLSQVELKTQSWYFIFQVVQVFLMTTFTSGASAVVSSIIDDPTSAPGLLAQNLPKASNFYISYFILYGLAQAASQLLNIVALLLYVILGKFFDKTPRKMYTRWMKLSGLGWGSEYPKWTNLGVIAISYSCIAPLVLGFSTLGFLFLYLCFRYKWLFVLGNQIDMKGAAYSKALQQLMTGVYLSTACLIGLFAIGTAKDIAGLGPLILMILFLIVAIAFQVVSDHALDPLEEGLPLDLTSSDAYDYEMDEFKTDNTGTQYPRPASGRPNMERLDSDTPINSDVEAHNNTNAATGNKLTQRLRPYIDSHFYAPNKDRQFELSEINYDYENAYYNPAITSREPFIWLARDECGVSQMLVRDNQAAGVESSDDHAWFDEKNKLHWSVDNVKDVTTMLDAKNRGQSQNEGVQAQRQENRDA